MVKEYAIEASDLLIRFLMYLSTYRHVSMCCYTGRVNRAVVSGGASMLVGLVR